MYLICPASTDNCVNAKKMLYHLVYSLGHGKSRSVFTSGRATQFLCHLGTTSTQTGIIALVPITHVITLLAAHYLHITLKLHVITCTKLLLLILQIRTLHSFPYNLGNMRSLMFAVESTHLGILEKLRSDVTWRQMGEGG